MIVGVGIDVVEVRRMRELLSRHPERAPARLFTPEERAWCEARASPAECYAARFAAKEALLKALGRGLSAGIEWRDIRVVSDGNGRPRLELAGRAREQLVEIGGRRLHVSLSHDGGLAVAIVILEDSTPAAG